MTRQPLCAAVSVYPASGRLLSFTMERTTAALFPEWSQPEDCSNTGTILFSAASNDAGVPLKSAGGRNRLMMRIPAPDWVLGKYRTYEPVSFEVEGDGLRITLPAAWKVPR